MEYIDGGVYITSPVIIIKNLNIELMANVLKYGGIRLKKDMKVLIIMNLLAYLNSIIFSNTYTLVGDNLKENWIIYGIWGLSPYVFITITTFIIAGDYKKEYKVFRKEAIVDWIIRFISFCTAFQEFDFKFLSFHHIFQQCIIILLLIISIALEVRMYKIAIKNNSLKEEYDGKKDILLNEKIDVENIGKATMKGVNSFYAYVFCVGIIISLFKLYNSPIHRVIIVLFSIMFFCCFLKVNLEKCRLVYIDKNMANKIFKNNAIYSVIGFIVFITITLISLNISNNSNYKVIANSVALIIQILFLYPTIQTNRKIGIRYREIQKESIAK